MGIDLTIEHIRNLMEEQGLSGNPNKCLVLWGWRWVADRHAAIPVDVTPPPRPYKQGARLYAVVGDGPELSDVTVIDDRGESLWVSADLPAGTSVQLELDEGSVKHTAIPLRPTVIRCNELWKYIGREAAEAWFKASARIYRRARRQAS